MAPAIILNYSYHFPLGGKFINPQRRLLHSLFFTKNQITPHCKSPSSSNSPLWSVHEIAEAVSGRIIRWGPPGTITTDTRTLEQGQWFLPVVGQNFDAHNFIVPELASKGCVGVIGNRVCENWEMGFVQVDDATVDSLKRLGLYARNQFSGCLIGLTGSVGKTTTRNMISLALQSIGSVYQTHGNWNNQIGVSLSLIRMPRNVDFVVLELGMSERGEILELARICRPHVRVISNVNASHLENFASLEEIALAKGEILQEAEPSDICVLNADDPLVMSLSVPEGVKKVLFGRKKGCDVRLVSAEKTNKGYGIRVALEKDDEMVEFVIPSPGLHLALNACAAAAVASILGAPLALAGKFLSKFTSIHGRSKIEVLQNGITLINDVYNANPASTKAAIDLLKSIDCEGKRIAILGDMLELGPSEINFHESILRRCRDVQIDVVAIVGQRFLAAAKDFKITQDMILIQACDTEEALSSEIVHTIGVDDVVLVKGSRGTKMERMVDIIKSF